MLRYLVFGAGEVGKKCKSVIEEVGHEVIGFSDNNPDKWGRVFEGVNIYCPSDITNITCDMIAIGIYKAAPTIRKQLLDMGIEDSKICVPLEPDRIFYNDRIDCNNHPPEEEMMSESTRRFLDKRIILNDEEFVDKLSDLKSVLENNNIPFWNVCVCSGAVLQAYGLRKSKRFDDIDVIMTSEYREIYGKGLVIISETAEMHPQDEYDIVDDEIIKNPCLHFWYEGLKFMNIDILYRQRMRDRSYAEADIIKRVLDE